jgi:hypothetical protein
MQTWQTSKPYLLFDTESGVLALIALDAAKVDTALKQAAQHT